MCTNVNIFENLFVGEADDGDDDDGGGRICPEHPSPILHAPRDNIARKDNPSLRLERRFYRAIEAAKCMGK